MTTFTVHINVAPEVLDRIDALINALAPLQQAVQKETSTADNSTNQKQNEPQEPANTPITDEMIRAITSPLLEKGKKEILKALFKEFGVANAIQLKQEQRKAFADRVSAS